MEGGFFLDTEAGQETYQTIKNVAELQEWSYALPEIDYEMRTIDGETIRVLKRIKVNEVSPVLMGAGIGTRTLSLKQLSEDRKRISGPLWLDGEELVHARKAGDPKGFLKAIRARWFEPDPELQAQLQTEAERFERICKEVEERSYVYYSETARVDLRVRQAAVATLEYCKRRLFLPWPITLIWVREEGPRERKYIEKWGFRDWESHRSKKPLWGWTKLYANKIFINADLSLWDACNVVAHELVHVTQPSTMPEAQREQQANQIAHQIVNEFAASRR
jgi:hypothetical protein